MRFSFQNFLNIEVILPLVIVTTLNKVLSNMDSQRREVFGLVELDLFLIKHEQPTSEAQTQFERVPESNEIGTREVSENERFSLH